MIAAFRRGVRFECTQCGKCCTSLSTAIPISRAEARTISRTLGVTLKALLTRWCRVRQTVVQHGNRRVTLRTITIKARGGRCLFVATNGECRIHEVKPLFCRHAPFVGDVAEGGEPLWQAIRRYCPGVGRGPLYTPARIRQMLRREQASVREDFDKALGVEQELDTRPRAPAPS